MPVPERYDKIKTVMEKTQTIQEGRIIMAEMINDKTMDEIEILAKLHLTDEEKEKYRGGLIATCKTYCHIDYDDDIEILELMFDTTLDEMTELIPNFDRNNLTSRQKLLAFMSVKELYDNRDKYRSDTKTLSAAVSSMLLKEIYGGAAE